MSKPFRQRGLTLIEVTIALFIAGLVAFIALQFFAGAKGDADADKFIRQMSQVMTAAIRSRGSQPTYSGATQTLILQSRRLPAAMINGTSIVNDYGQLAFAPVALNGVAAAGMQVTSPGVPLNICITGVPALETSVESIAVNGTAVKPQNGTLDLQALSDNCAAASSIAFVVR